MMTVIHVLFWVAALVALWKLWQLTTRGDRRLRWIIGAGLAMRVIASLLLFGIVAGNLPILESYRSSEGYWFFALDSRIYFDQAIRASDSGPLAIASLARVLPSANYIQALSGFTMLFGDSTLSATLLNIFAWLGLCALMVWWGMRRGPVTRELLIALSAVAFCPTWILWSTVPLKDVFFVFLVGLLFWALSVWVRFAPPLNHSSRMRLDLAAVLILIVMAGIGGIRWYFSVFLLGSCGLCMALVLMRGLHGRLIAGSLLVLLLSPWMIVFAAGPQLPPQARSLLSLGLIGDADFDFVGRVEDRRSGFEHTHGGTRIQAGERLDDLKIRGLAAGAVAFFVPREIATPLGLVEIGGGRGLWLFADLDTVYFDLFLLLAIVVSVRRGVRSVLRDPLWVSLAVTAFVVTVPLVYVVTNFGTLFRLREMVFLEVALILLVGGGTAPRKGSGGTALEAGG